MEKFSSVNQLSQIPAHPWRTQPPVGESRAICLGYNRCMAEFKFRIPLEVRYGDLDPQWHVNNARYLSFLEQGRMNYLIHLGLWDGLDFNRLGLIVADVHIAYRAPILFGQSIYLEQRVSRLGNKSLTFEYRICDEATGAALATAESIMVAYDYNAHQSIPVPDLWRERIGAYEGWSKDNE